jgi:hypothetical protein
MTDRWPMWCGWIVALLMAIAALLCELGREMAVDHAGLLHANLRACQCRLEELKGK